MGTCCTRNARLGVCGMSTVLGVASIMALAVNPQCGAAIPESEFSARLVAIALHESAGGNPLAIGVNADPARGLPAGSFSPSTPAKAIEIARALIAQHRSVDLGLMAINSGQMARHGLTVETAFDSCASMRAGAEHYAADVSAAALYDLAHRRYNTGGFQGGAAYVAAIKAQLRKVRGQVAAPAPTQTPPPPSKLITPLCAPAWDGWALALCSARQRALPPAVAPAAAVTLATNGDQPDASAHP